MFTTHYIAESDFDRAVKHLTNQVYILEVMEWVDGRDRSAYVHPPDGNAVYMDLGCLRFSWAK